MTYRHGIFQFEEKTSGELHRVLNTYLDAFANDERLELVDLFLQQIVRPDPLNDGKEQLFHTATVVFRSEIAEPNPVLEHPSLLEDWIRSERGTDTSEGADAGLGTPDTHTIDLVESLTALSSLWNKANDSQEKARPFHVTVLQSDERFLVAQANPEDEGLEKVVVGRLDLSLLTELGYAGVMQWKGDYSLLYLTPEGIEFAENAESTVRGQRRQKLIDRLDERQGRSS